MDSNIEQEISKFLDEYFYSKAVKDFERHSDYETQMKGVDVSYSTKFLKNILVDEKAAAHYINKDIPTFAFEVDFFTSKGELVDGWLFDQSKLTQYYWLMWIKATKDRFIKKEDITSLECVLVERAKIIDYLGSCNLYKDELQKISIDARKKNIDGVFGKNIRNAHYYFLSQQLAEKPFNVIIQRKKLDQLAHAIFIVTPKNIVLKKKP